MTKRHFLLPVFLIASTFALAACGGGESEEDQIVDVIETSVISSDPTACSEFATVAFVEQTEQTQGDAALKKCEEDAENTSDDPESVAVSAVDVDGSKATAEVAFVGSSFDGQTVNVALVKEGDQWKLDRLTKFTKFDEQALIEAFEEALTKGPEALSDSQAACIVESLEGASQGEVEAALLSRSQASLEALFEGC